MAWIDPDWPGNLIKQGVFSINRYEFLQAFIAKAASLGHFTQFAAQQEKARPQELAPSNPAYGQLSSLHEDAIIWLVHATFIIQLNGRRMITNPILDKLSALKRYPALPMEQDRILGLDYILLNHNHRDHCDEKRLKALFTHNEPAILTSLKMGTIVQPWLKPADIQEAGWYQQYNLHEVGICGDTNLPSRHWCPRGYRFQFAPMGKFCDCDTGALHLLWSR